MYYAVPGMKLIPQDMKMSCWYASAQMIIQYSREKEQQTRMAVVDPSEDSMAVKIRTTDKGISDAQIIALGKELGLVLVPPMSPTPEALMGWLMTYGPLWINGVRHITVLAGIRSEGDGKTKLLIYDPSPVKVGKIEWRDISWYTDDGWSGRDTQTNTAVFMYVPR